MKKIKFCYCFDKKSFTDILLKIQLFDNNHVLRPIDTKILKYLLNISVGDFQLFYALFKLFEVDCDINSEGSFNIIKLFLKGKSFDNLIPVKMRSSITNTLNDLKLNLFKKGFKTATILGAFELFYCIRTNRIHLKKYVKYKGLVKSLLSDNNFNAFNVLFFNETKTFCDNSYYNLKSMFTNNVKVNSNDKKSNKDTSTSNSNSKNLSNSNNIYDNKFLNLVGLEGIKENFAKLIHLTNLLKEYNTEFSDFISNRKKSFYLGSYRLCIHLVSNCIEKLQKNFAEFKIREKCETLINEKLNLDKSNTFDLGLFYDLEEYFDEFFNNFQYKPLDISTWSNESLSVCKFNHVLGHFMENLLPYSDLKLSKTYNKDINKELNLTSFKHVYAKLKTKRIKKILAEFDEPFGTMKDLFESGLDINWKKLKPKQPNSKLKLLSSGKKLESKSFNDKNDLHLLFFVKDLNDIIFKTFEDFILKFGDSFNWVFNNEQVITMEKKDALKSVNQIKK